MCCHRTLACPAFTLPCLHPALPSPCPAFQPLSGLSILQGNRVGEVRQRWHPWRRRYDLYLGHRQVADIDGPLLAWEFELRDAEGRTLALIDRCARLTGWWTGLLADGLPTPVPYTHSTPPNNQHVDDLGVVGSF